MKLASPNGTVEFDMKVRGYANPEMETEDYDSNWLSIYVSVVHPRCAWTTVDPSLLTYELSALGDWLESVCSGDYSKRDISFIEPNLSFLLLPEEGEPTLLQVVLSHEAAPPWMKGTEEACEGFPLDFGLSSLDLVGAVTAIREEAREFPQRGRM